MIYDATIPCSVTVYFDATRTPNRDEPLGVLVTICRLVNPLPVDLFHILSITTMLVGLA